ncbi:tumor necrosis factor ligand superfamily member 15 [Mantella aurantiaca]
MHCSAAQRPDLTDNAAVPEAADRDKTQDKLRPPQNLNKTVKKPRAHLRATNQSTTKTKDTYLLWESQNGLAFAKDGMKFDNQSIQIPSMGYYFVYCQVSLKFSSSSKDNYFEARIVKVNGNYPAPEDLFKGKVHRDTQNTIYMAGLLFLIRGDKLKVNVTDVNQVDNSSEHTTYFGAFWVMDGKSS